MKAFSFSRCSVWTVLLMALCVPVILWGCWGSFRNMYNAPVLWLPEEVQPRQDLEWFIDTFQTDDVVVVSWDGCTVDDPRLKQFAEELASPERIEYIRNNTNLEGHALDGYTMLRQLMDPPAGLSRSQALLRLQGLLVGPDLETSCALAATEWRSQHYREATVDFLADVAREVGVPERDLRLAGPYVESVAIDEASARSFSQFAGPSALIAALLCWMCLKSWRVTLAILLVAAFSEALVIAIVHFAGIRLNAILIVMAPLVLVLAVSAGVHLTNYYRDALKSHGAAGAARRAMAIGWWPCTFCAITTAIGMSSLMVSEIIPVWQFGAISAPGVLITLCLLFLVIPGAMQWHSKAILRRGEHVEQPGWDRGGRNSHIVARLVTRGSVWIVICCLAVLALGLYGLTKVRTSVKVVDLLPADNPLVRDYRWFEEQLGPLVPVEVILHFDADSELDMLERAVFVRHAANQLRQLETLDGVTAASSFLPPIPQSGGIRQTMRRSVIRNRLDELKPQLVEDSWLHEGPQQQSWRISARVPAFGDVNYGDLLSEMRENVSRVLEQSEGEPIGATYTGLTPVVYQAQQALLDDLFRSFLTALILVSFVLMFVFRSVAMGLIALIPNIFPSAVLFGSMGLLGIAVDIGTVMTASVALGIAVDDAIHFLTWYQREQQAGRSRRRSIQIAYRHAALAMFQTTAICGLGLAIFIFSDFMPTRRFAWMMATLLFAALAGDLLLLPAMLASPLGRLVAPRKRPTPSEPQRSVPIGR